MEMFFWENEKNLWSHFVSRSSDGIKSEFCPVFLPLVSQIFGFGNFYGMSIVNTSCTTYVPNLVVLAKLEVSLSPEDAKTWYPHSGHFGMWETEKNLKARGLIKRLTKSSYSLHSGVFLCKIIRSFRFWNQIGKIVPTKLDFFQFFGHLHRFWGV